MQSPKGVETNARIAPFGDILSVACTELVEDQKLKKGLWSVKKPLINMDFTVAKRFKRCGKCVVYSKTSE
jgi:hypothetical protein